jgi:hypothetical protein
MKNLDLTNKSIVQQLVTEIEKSEDRERKASAFDAWQVYSGNQKPYVETEIQRTRPKSWKVYTISDVSVAKMVTTKRAASYKEQPKRDVENNDVKNERLSSIYSEADANRQLQFLDTTTNLHKYSLMWVNWLELEQRYQFMTLQPYEFSVVRDKDTGELIGVILSYGNQDITASSQSGDGYDDLIAESQADSAAQTKTYAMWSKENYVVIKYSKNSVNTASGENVKRSIDYVTQPNNPNMVNVIGMIPFVFVSNETAIDYPTRNPLAMQSVTYNALMSEALTAANIQGTGVSILKYPDHMSNKFKNLSTGLTQTVKLPQSTKQGDPSTEFDYRSPSPSLLAQKEVYMTYLKQVLAEHGITTSAGVSSDGSDFSSGLHMMIANSDVQSIIEMNQELYVDAEKQMFDIIKAWESFNNKTFFKPEDELNIKFKKPKMMISDKETLENIQKMLELDLIEDHEALMMFDPNLTDEMAKEKLARIKTKRMNQLGGFINGGQGNENTGSEQIRPGQGEREQQQGES